MKIKTVTRCLLALFLILLCASASPAWAQLAGKKVVIDPGHGGTDPGAVGIDGGAFPNEEDFVLNVALRVRTKLQNAGATVAMTRTTDTTVSLTARRDLINNQNPNCAFSIHCNSFSDSSAHGTETFWWTSGNSADQNIATKVQNRLLTHLGRHNRGVKQANFTVITANPPTCLSEMLFISNQTEFNIINGEAGKENAALAHYYAVGDFLGINLDTPPPPVNNASVVSMSYPGTVNAGQVFSGTITMNNNGTKVWNNDGTPHSLGSQNPQDNNRWGTGRIGLPFTPVNPGQNASFTFNFTAPATPGTYAFDWRMVEDGVQWFGATAVGSINVVAVPPSITTQPVTQTKNPGESVTFTVAASGTAPLSYQWQKDGVNISGGTGASHTINNLTVGNAGFFRCVVSNAGGSATSSAAQLVMTTSPSAVGTGTGLQGSYYDNIDLTNLKIQRTDGTVNFDWGTGSPDASIAADTFSARWTGQVEPRYSQTYTFYTSTDDGVRLWVNGQLLIDKWVNQGATEWSGTIALNAGQRYDIQMDYFENTGAASATLSWSSASQIKQIIPQTQLYGINPPTITTQPQSQTVAAGANVTFTVGATGPAPLSYQWRLNAANISGATASAYTPNNVQSGDAGNYSVVVSNPGGSVTSANATLTVNSPPAITAQPQSQTVAPGVNVTFSVSATGSSPLSYQWSFNGATISGATTSSLVRNNVQAANIGYYSVFVGNPFGSVTSSTATLSLNAALVFNETFESGNLNNWTVASGSTTLTISTAQNHTSPGANSAFVTSSANKMYRNLGSEVEGRARATFWIYDDSGTQTRAFGETRSYTGAGYNDGGLQQLFAIGRYSVGFGTGTGTLAGEVVNTAKYQGRVVAGANTGWFNLNANRSTGWHKFEIERAADGSTIHFYVDGALDRTITAASFATWDSVTIGSLGSGTTAGNAWFDDVTVEYFDGPTISTQPASQSVNAGTDVTLSVGASPNVSSYQWRKNGVNISGATAAALVFNNAQQSNAGTYSVIVRNGIGIVTSANATLTVTDIAPVISTQPQSQNLLVGDNLTLTVVARGTDPLTYQWRKNAVNISGATTTSYSKSNVQTADSGNYSVVVVNSLGNVTSDNAVVNVSGGNNAPVLNAIGNKSGNEGSAITFTASATDPDTGDTLTFSLDAGAPSGASINGTSGAFSWTPTEAQGPGVYSITVRVTDNGTPVESDFETISVTVSEVNAAPILAAIGNKTVNEGVALTFTAAATDSDVPANTLTYSLDAGAPSGASINSSSGAFSWTPTEAQGPGVYSITVRVTDNGSPSLNDFETISVTVNEVNSAPVLASIGNRIVDELSALTFTAAATDSDVPANTLTYSLDAGAPSGASINSSSGAFSWTPTEAQGPGVYSITVRVTDNGSPNLNDFETISVTVNEANVAPVLSLGNARVTETFAHFETFADGFGNDLVMFRKPSNSSTTAGFLDATPDTTLVTATFPSGHASAKVSKASFSFKTGTTNPWLRLTTFNSANLPNPTIDFGQTLRFDIYTDKAIKVGLGLRESGTSAAIGANGGTTGAIEFVGVPTKTGSMPNPSRTVTAGSWTTLEFTLPAEPAISFNAGNGVLAAGKGVLEHLALVPAGGMGVYNVYLDNFQVVYTQTMPSTVNMNSGSILSFTASATDSDTPAQTLSYSLDAGAPAGTSINSGSGAFTWTPTSGQAGTHNLTVRATDNGPGNLSDAKPFTVIVTADPMAPQSGANEGAVASGETVSLSWNAVPGQKYFVQYKEDLSADDWTTLREITASSENESVTVENGDGDCFYRIVLAETSAAADE